MISPRAKALFDQYRLLAAAPQNFDLAAIRASCEGAEQQTTIPAGVHFAEETLAGVELIRCTPPKFTSAYRVIYLHGGAHCLMSAKTHARMCGHLALACGAEVLVPDYRLAPENAFPEGLNDALAVISAQGIPTALAGDSSGGGLAAACLLSLLGDKAQPFCAVLMSPWLDLTLSLPSVTENAVKDLMLREGNLRQFAALYLAGNPAITPLASPLHANLGSLPPILLQAAEDDLLRDDALLFAEKLRQAGNAATLELYPQMQHSFQFFAGRIPEADAALKAAAQFIAAHEPLASRSM